MRSPFRYLLALLLSLVLPLQAGAGLARAVTMVPLATAAHPAEPAAAAHAPVQRQMAHAVGVAHQHGAHAHHEQLPNQKARSAVPASHKAKHAKGECPTCAKCCLLAAVAPPAAFTPESSVPVSRVAFLAASLSIPSFLPDGPERPPRTHLAA